MCIPRIILEKDRQIALLKDIIRKLEDSRSKDLTFLKEEAFKVKDQQLELLESESVLIVPGSSFNIDYRNYFRVTLLPEAVMIGDVFERIERALCRSAERQHRSRQVA